MPMSTKLYWSKSASVMYIRIPSFPEGKKKLHIPPEEWEGLTAYRDR